MGLYFAPEAYHKVNYEVWKVVLSGNSVTRAFIGADFIDVMKSTADLSKVYISFNGGLAVPVSSAIPAHTAFGLVNITWDSSEDGKEIYFIVGHDYFKSAKQSVSILADYSGIKTDLDNLLGTVATESTLSDIDTKITQPTTLKGKNITIDNSAGTAPLTQNLFATSTPSKKASIKNTSSTVTVQIGDGTDNADLAPSEIIETTISDLSKVVVVVPAGATATLKVFWEV